MSIPDSGSGNEGPQHDSVSHGSHLRRESFGPSMGKGKSMVNATAAQDHQSKSLEQMPQDLVHGEPAAMH